MGRPKQSVLHGAVLLACLASSPLRADTESAKSHYKRGLSAYALGRFKE